MKNRLQKWVVWIGIIGSLLTTGGVITSKFTKAYQQIKDNRGFSEVLCGLLIAEMHPVDSLDYYVTLEGHKVKVKLRQAAGSKNIYAFVLNKKMMVYFASWNDSEQKYSYVDFNGKYYLIQTE